MFNFPANLKFQKGQVNPIVLIGFAALGVIGFLIITYSATFEDKLFALLYPKQASYAAPVPRTSTGNGAPSGTHYNLNIIGVPKEKTADMTGSSGHRIFVKLGGNTKINLAEGSEFKVLDANGTDGNGASFQMPNPDPDGDGVTEYSVYARALGKPGGKATLNTCATGAGEDGDFGTADDEEVCSIDILSVERSAGRQTFENVSRDLLYVSVYIDGVLTRIPLFDDRLIGYLWDYDNYGLKLLQLRFYPISTNVN